MSDKSHFEKTVLLSFGHLGVVVASFLIPVFLSRWLPVETYGTYKQLMLVYLLAMVVGHMGMDNGLFYFIKNHPEKRGLFSLNAMFFDSLMAGAIGIGLCLFAPSLSKFFNNAEIVPHVPLFALFLFFSIPTQHFEHYLTVLDDIKAAIAVSFIYETLKAGVIVGIFYLYDSMEGVFTGLAVLTAIKYGVLLAFNLVQVRRSGIGPEECLRFFRRQVRFSVPQGLTNLIAFCLKLDKFVISSFFSVRQFTIYAVGCFEIPLIGSVSNTMTDLMSFDMVGARQQPDRLKYLWHTTIRKVALFQIPVAAFLVFFAEPLIRVVFSDTYRESAPYFRLFTVTLLAAGFSPEILFRVFARTGRLLKLQAGAALYTVGAVIGAAYFFGPLAALGAKLVCDVLTLILYSRDAAILLGLRPADYFPWKAVGKITAIGFASAATSAVIALPPQLPPFSTLAFGACVHGMILLLTAVPFGLLMNDEVTYLKAKLSGFLPFAQKS